MIEEKTMKRKVGLGTMWLTGSGVLMKVIGIAYVVLVLRNLSVYEYGLVELTLSILPMLSLLSLTGLHPVITADLITLNAQSKVDDMRNLISSYISIRFLLAILAACGLYLSTILLSDHFHENIILMVQLLVCSLLVSPFRSLILIACTVTHNFRTLSFFNFSGELFKLITILILFTYFSLGPLAAVLAFVISDVVIGLLFIPAIFTMRKELFEGRLMSGYILKPLYVLRDHAKWSVFQVGVYFFGQNIRPWIIQFFLGTQAVGLYGVATGMFQHVSSLFPLSRVIAPVIPTYLDRKYRLIQFINSAIKYQLIILVGLSLLAVAFMPILIDVFFPDYVNAYPLFVLLTFTLIPGSYSRIFESVFHALKLQKSLFTSNLLLLGMTALVLPIALKLFGLYGIALEFFVTGTLYTLGRYKVLKKSLPGYVFSAKSLYKISQTDKWVLEKIKFYVTKSLAFLKLT